jgi:hypothetical protein
MKNGKVCENKWESMSNQQQQQLEETNTVQEYINKCYNAIYIGNKDNNEKSMYEKCQERLEQKCTNNVNYKSVI